MWLYCYRYDALAEESGVGVWAPANKKEAPDWTADGLSKAMIKVLDGNPARISIMAKAKDTGGRESARRSSRTGCGRQYHYEIGGFWVLDHSFTSLE